MFPFLFGPWAQALLPFIHSEISVRRIWAQEPGESDVSVGEAALYR